MFLCKYKFIGVVTVSLKKSNFDSSTNLSQNVWSGCRCVINKFLISFNHALFAEFQIVSGQSISVFISSIQKQEQSLCNFGFFLASFDNLSLQNGLGVGVAHHDHRILHNICVINTLKLISVFLLRIDFC